MRLGPIIIGRVVIPSNEFPFDESYDKGKNIFGICKRILENNVPSRESAGVKSVLREHGHLHRAGGEISRLAALARDDTGGVSR